MDSRIVDLIPAPDAIPAPWWVFEVLGDALFLVHILLVDVVLGGALIFLWRRVVRGGPLVTPGSAGKGGPALSPAAPLVKALPSTMAFAITIGVAPLLFLQVNYGHLFYASSVLMATFWLLVIPLLILGYYGLYAHARLGERRPTLVRVSIVVSAVVFLYVGFMLTSNITLMQQPALWTEWFESRGGTILPLGQPTLLPRYLHFVVAAVAVAGLVGALTHAWRARRVGESAPAAVKGGLRLFAVASLVQIAVGLWWFLVLPAPVRKTFMGGDMAATVVFGAGLLLSVVVVVTAFRGQLRATVVGLAVTMVLMVANRAQLRMAYLDPVAAPADLTVEPQYGALVAFLAVLVVGLGAVAWMLKASFAAPAARVAHDSQEAGR